jgi:hypothetical protein
MKNKTYYWTTKSGEKINVDDMDITHLRNALKMIIRNVENQPKRINFTLNGDMANYFNEQMEEYEYYDDQFQKIKIWKLLKLKAMN